MASNLRSSLEGLGSLRGGGGVLTRWRGRGTQTHLGSDRDRERESTVSACSNTVYRPTRALCPGSVRSSGTVQSSRRPACTALIGQGDLATQTLPPELQCTASQHGQKSEDRVGTLSTGSRIKECPQSGGGPIGEMRLFVSFPDALEYQSHRGASSVDLGP